jgi:hypothetical protein
MAQNVTENLEVCTGIDLPAGVTVAEYMRSKCRCLDSGKTGVEAYAMADSSAG